MNSLSKILIGVVCVVFAIFACRQIQAFAGMTNWGDGFPPFAGYDGREDAIKLKLITVYAAEAVAEGSVKIEYRPSAVSVPRNLVIVSFSRNSREIRASAFK